MMACCRPNKTEKGSLSTSCTKFKNLIVDVGGVLLQPNLDLNYGTAVSPYQFKRILHSKTWFKYQTGELSSDEAFAQLSKRMGCSALDLREFCRKAREALVPIPEIVQIIDTLDLKLICMTNTPAEEFEAIQHTFASIFSRFQKIFTSSATGMRKPNLNFFKHVLAESGIEPSETVFLDDDLANVTAAESLGITSILVPSPREAAALAQTVNQLVSSLRTSEEQLSVAREYLVATKGVDRSLALTHEGLRIPVIFDHFIIAELLGDEKFLPIESPPQGGTINFFPKSERSNLKGYSENQNAFTHINYPDDIDTTSVGLSTLYKFSKVQMSLIDNVLDRIEKELVSEDGLFQVYFDPQRPRVDSVCIINVLYLFHLAGRGGTSVTRPSEEFILNLLQHRGYRRGTIYYISPEAFLLQLARLVFGFPAHFKKAGFVKLLKSRVLERVGKDGSALTLAMRILACVMCGMESSCVWEVEQLTRLQNVNGSWDVCPYYRYNNVKAWIGNEALTTAFAVAAIEAHQRAFGKPLQKELRSGATGTVKGPPKIQKSNASILLTGYQEFD
ncbi:hypothetical protein R1sor_025452 [Riccia sorocarpa]|uniref:Uncharacterized protein n=1 Tax=Riccia sorocarpa TaxID=122646 RepID=A0ABD3GCK6_9MARC